MTIFEVLAREHAEIDARFTRVRDASTPEAAREPFQALATKLITCMRAEHAIVYPRFAFLAGLDDEVAQAVREHDRVEQAINYLRLSTLGPDAWHAGVSRLQQLVRNHLETEEWILIPVARLRLSNEDIVKIGEEFLSFEPIAASAAAPSITYEPSVDVAA